MNKIALVLCTCSLVASAIVVYLSPDIQSGTAEMFAPVACIQVLAVITSIAFAAMVFVFPYLTSMIKEGDHVPAIKRIKSELSQDVIILFVLLTFAFVFGILDVIDIPFFKDEYIIKKQSIVSWGVLNCYCLSFFSLGDLIFASLKITDINHDKETADK